MGPLLWQDRRFTACVLAVFGWLISIELRTSRTASRAAQPDSGDRVVDTSTGKVFDIAAAVALAGGVTASARFPDATIRARRTSATAGLCVLAGSGVLSKVARFHLGRFHRDSLTVHADHELVDTGPYRRIRHPLYSATIGVFIGLGLVLGNWLSLVLAGFPTAALVLRIGVEEQMLAGHLGPTYDQYRTRTDRLVPGIW